MAQWLRKHERDIVVTPIALGESKYDIGLTTSICNREELGCWSAEGMRRLRVINLGCPARSSAKKGQSHVLLSQDSKFAPLRDPENRTGNPRVLFGGMPGTSPQLPKSEPWQGPFSHLQTPAQCPGRRKQPSVLRWGATVIRGH
jgi:hypothetical protein